MGGAEIRKEFKDIVLSAFVATFCFILSSLAIFKMPFGGSITLGHTLPLIFLSIKRGYRVGGKAAIIFCIIKLMFGFHVPPSQTMISYLAVISLDYILPYCLVGISSAYAHFFKEERNNVVFAVVISEFFRFAFSTFSGLVIWNDYFEYNLSVLWWCAVYNLSYMIPNLVISLVIVFLIYKNREYMELILNHTF